MGVDVAVVFCTMEKRLISVGWDGSDIPKILPVISALTEK